MNIRSLAIKVSIRVLALVIIVAVGISMITVFNVGDLVEDLTQEQAEAANRTFQTAFDDYLEEASEKAQIIADNRDVLNALLMQNHDRLQELLQELDAGVDLITLCDSSGIAMARSHSDEYGDDVSGQAALATALSTGTGISTIESGSVIGLSTRGSAAIYDLSGNIVGAVTCGHDLSDPKYVDKIKSQSGCEVTLFAGDERMSTTITNEKGERVIGTKASDLVVETVIQNRQTYNGRVTLFGTQYEVCYTPLIVNNNVIGMLFSGYNIEDTLARQQGLYKTIIIFSIIVCAVGIAFIIEESYRILTKPLKKIGAFAKQMEHGTIGVSAAEKTHIDIRTKDEIGHLARALENTCDALKGYVGEISDKMSEISEGNLSVGSEYPFEGDFVAIKDAINHIVGSLSGTMSEIRDTAAQVSSASHLLANGAQSVAQGSAEQASAVEQLSASIGEVANMTGENAELALKASELGADIKAVAERGTVQMDQMIGAVTEINEASQKIGKVIKVIDDIAFQTNILALNAAVEAARAGQHGKGFAVVAEEVRSLASKSAEAAKDTGGLITDSMEKAQLGVRIAGETAVSLSRIASGINESSRIVADIARLSGDQNAATNQINIGIDQVSQVVQQNNAAAEESAAASQEMSGQSDTLHDLVANFKLGDEPRLPARGEGHATAKVAENTATRGGYGKY